jgi:signal recognition particle GTPase
MNRVNRLVEKFKKKIWKKKREKLLEEKIKDLEAKLLEADIKLSGFEVYHSKVAYRLMRQACRLEKKRCKRVRDYVV